MSETSAPSISRPASAIGLSNSSIGPHILFVAADFLQASQRLFLFFLALCFPLKAMTSSGHSSAVAILCDKELPCLQEGRAALWLEGAEREKRANGWFFSRLSSGYLKCSAEWLSQSVDYPEIFVKRAWLWQLSGGASYFWEWPAYIDYFALSAYWASASGKRFESLVANGQLEDGDHFLARLQRRISGAISYGFNGGPIWRPLPSMCLGLLFHYDGMDCDTSLLHIGTKDGFGATLFWKGCCGTRLFFQLSGSLRRPYDYISGSLHWMLAEQAESWSLGIFGRSVKGKLGTPSGALVGLELHWGLYPTAGASSLAIEPAYWAPNIAAIADYKGSAVRWHYAECNGLSEP